MHYEGKLHYIGVFDSNTKAGLAYEIAGQVLGIANKSKGPFNAKEVAMNVEVAQTAAVECVAALTKKNDEYMRSVLDEEKKGNGGGYPRFPLLM